MSAVITPSPPGFAAAFTNTSSRRTVDPAPQNLFSIGFTDRGDVAQGTGPTEFLAQFGLRTNYSQATDDFLTSIVEAGNAAWAFGRIVGPAAVASSLVLQTSAPAPAGTLALKHVGDWGNGLKASVTADGAKRQIVVKEGTTIIALSPSASTNAELGLWEHELVKYTPSGSTLPAVLADTSLAGGTDDRASVTDADHGIALAKLKKQWGPGILTLPCSDADSITALAVEHCDANNRVLLNNKALNASIAAAQASTAALRVSNPLTARHEGLFSSWAYTNPRPGEPQRLVSWASIQAGICSRVIRTKDICTPAFGPTEGLSRLATGLHPASEYSEAERSALYAKGVNVAVDDGQTISTWGFRTADLDPLHLDLHHQFVRMGLRFETELELKAMLGKPLDADTFASLHGRIETICKRYQRLRGLYGTEEDPGYLIDLNSVNTPTTIAAREIHAALSIRQSSTVDWADLAISVGPNSRPL